MTEIKIKIEYSEEDGAFVASLNDTQLAHGDTEFEAFERLLEYLSNCAIDEILDVSKVKL